MKDHLLLIAEMTREFTASHDYKTIAHSALERITKYVGAEAASLFLVGDGGESLACSACYGPVDITGLRISAKTGVVGRSVQTREGIMVRDVSQDKDFGAAVDAKTGFKTRSLLVAPLAMAILAVGFTRANVSAKGWEYYSHNTFFWLKIASFALVGLLSIAPTMAFLRWRRALAKSEMLPAAAEVGTARTFLVAEAVVFAFIPVFAAAMARGYGNLAYSF